MLTTIKNEMNICDNLGLNESVNKKHIETKTKHTYRTTNNI